LSVYIPRVYFIENCLLHPIEVNVTGYEPECLHISIYEFAAYFNGIEIIRTLFKMKYKQKLLLNKNAYRVYNYI